MLSEEGKVIQQEESTENLTAFNRIPYALINAEVEDGSDLMTELTEICKYYKIYKKGMAFAPSGNNGDYIPADLRYKMCATLVNKEARFLFAEAPTISVDPKGDLGKTSDEAKDALLVINDLVTTVLEKNMFEDALLKAAKDCFIGKRVAGLVNFNEDEGITVTFLPSTQFLYSTRVGNGNILEKFICFMIVKDCTALKDKIIFKKKYTLEDGVVYLEEALYDGAGALIEEVTSKTEISLTRIPAVVFLNDGLTGDSDGESEIEELMDYEKWFSKMSNSDLDAGQKSMNPIRYTVDMESNSTKNLSSSAGSQWDLGSDQNLDNAHPMVGMLEPAMNYSDALAKSLDRIKTAGYEQVDMPNITLETMVGAITSGKALKAIYWPLIVRCKEKMKMWGPKLQALIEILIEGSFAYPNCAEQYLSDSLSPVAYRVSIVPNNPLPEDEVEEKNMDISEVESKLMSRKTYMQKWRQLTDDQVQEELEQIALERQIIEDSAFGMGGNVDDNLDDGMNEPYGEVQERGAV